MNSLHEMLWIIQQRNTGFCDLAWSPQIFAPLYLHYPESVNYVWQPGDHIFEGTRKISVYFAFISWYFPTYIWFKSKYLRCAQDMGPCLIQKQVVQCPLPPIPENSSRLQYGCKNIISIIKSSSKNYHRHFGATWLLKTTLVEATSHSGPQFLSNSIWLARFSRYSEFIAKDFTKASHCISSPEVVY